MKLYKCMTLMFSCYCGAAIGIWFIYGDFFIVLLQIAVPLFVYSAAGRDTRRAASIPVPHAEGMSLQVKCTSIFATNYRQPQFSETINRMNDYKQFFRTMALVPAIAGALSSQGAEAPADSTAVNTLGELVVTGSNAPVDIMDAEGETAIPVEGGPAVAQEHLDRHRLIDRQSLHSFGRQSRRTEDEGFRNPRVARPRGSRPRMRRHGVRLERQRQGRPHRAHQLAPRHAYPHCRGEVRTRLPEIQSCHDHGKKTSLKAK